jgi:hypothetical protein
MRSLGARWSGASWRSKSASSSERDRAGLEPERDKLAQGLAAQKAKLASVKEKMEIFVEEGRHETAQATRCDRDYSISEDEVEVAFLAEKERRAGALHSNG